MRHTIAFICALVPICAFAAEHAVEAPSRDELDARGIVVPLVSPRPFLLRSPTLGNVSGTPSRATTEGEPVRTALALTPPALPPSVPFAPRTSRPNAVVPALEAAGMTAVMMGWNTWIGDARWANVGLDTAWRNVGHWTFDDDQLFVNMFGHPYQGTWTFSAARSAGIGYWQSIPYTFAASLVWEIAGETQPASINDQVTTVIAGAVLGEVLHRLSLDVVGNGRDGWRLAGAAVVSPMTVLNRSLLGPAPPERPASTSWELTAGPVVARLPRDATGPAAAAETHGRVHLAVVHGEPWRGAFEPEHPFDHYRLELGYGALADPHLTMLARGLLAGTSFEALDRVRGIYGAFAGFDLDTPGAFRVSTTSVGFGVTAGAVLTSALSLDGSAILSGVAMGGAGMLPHDKKDRDYRMGPGAQSALELQLTAWDRAALRLGARSYFLVGVDRAGEDWIHLASATGIFQLARSHGIGVELSVAGRAVHDVGGARWTQTGTWWQAFYRLGRLSSPRGSVSPPGGSVGGMALDTHPSVSSATSPR